MRYCRASLERFDEVFDFMVVEYYKNLALNKTKGKKESGSASCDATLVYVFNQAFLYGAESCPMSAAAARVRGYPVFVPVSARCLADITREKKDIGQRGYLDVTNLSLCVVNRELLELSEMAHSINLTISFAKISDSNKEEIREKLRARFEASFCEGEYSPSFVTVSEAIDDLERIVSINQQKLADAEKDVARIEAELQRQIKELEKKPKAKQFLPSFLKHMELKEVAAAAVATVGAGVALAYTLKR